MLNNNKGRFLVVSAFETNNDVYNRSQYVRPMDISQMERCKNGVRGLGLFFAHLSPLLGPHPAGGGVGDASLKLLSPQFNLVLGNKPNLYINKHTQLSSLM